jgi:hypothetical protein
MCIFENYTIVFRHNSWRVSILMVAHLLYGFRLLTSAHERGNKAEQNKQKLFYG